MSLKTKKRNNEVESLKMALSQFSADFNGDFSYNIRKRVYFLDIINSYRGNNSFISSLSDLFFCRSPPAILSSYYRYRESLTYYAEEFACSG